MKKADEKLSELKKGKADLKKIEIKWFSLNEIREITKDHIFIIIVIIFFLGIHTFNYPLNYRSTDETVYIFEAKNFDILKTRHPPVYPFILNLTSSILGYDLKWAELVNILFTLGTMVVIYLIGLNFYNKKVGIYATVLFGATVPVLVYSHRVLIEPVLTFFIALTFLLLILDSPVMSGISLGIALMIKDQAYFLVPIIITYLLIEKNIRDGVKDFAKTIVPAIIIFSPWLYRIISEYGILHYFIWRSTYVGMTTKVQPASFYVMNLSSEIGILSILFLFLGIFSILVRRQRNDLIILLSFLIFFIPVSLFRVKAWYYMLPAFPFMALIAAIGLRDVGRIISKELSEKESDIIILFILTVTIFFPLKTGIMNLSYLKNLDLGADRAGEYLVQITDENDVVMVSWCSGYYDYYTHFKREPIGFPKTEKELLKIGPDFIVLDFNNPGMIDAPLAKEYAYKMVPGYEVLKVFKTDGNPIAILKKSSS